MSGPKLIHFIALACQIISICKAANYIDILPRFGNDSTCIQVKTSVVIVGDGPTSAQAALDLSDRCFNVTWVIPQKTQLRDNVEKVYWPVDHNAYLFRQLLTDKLQLNEDVFIKENYTRFIFTRFGRYRMLNVSGSTSENVWYGNVRRTLARYCVGWWAWEKIFITGKLRALFKMDVALMNRLFTKYTLEQFAQRYFNEPFYKCILKPWASGSGLPVYKIKASEALKRMLYYFTSDPMALTRSFVPSVTYNLKALMDMVRNKPLITIVPLETIEGLKLETSGETAKATGLIDLPNTTFDHVILNIKPKSFKTILTNLQTRYDINVTNAIRNFSQPQETTTMFSVLTYLTNVSMEDKKLFKDAIYNHFVDDPTLSQVIQLHLVDHAMWQWAEDNKGMVLQSLINHYLPPKDVIYTLNDIKQLWKGILPSADVVNATITEFDIDKFRSIKNHLVPSDYLQNYNITNVWLATPWTQSLLPNGKEYVVESVERLLTMGRQVANEILYHSRIREYPMRVASLEGNVWSL